MQGALLLLQCCVSMHAAFAPAAPLRRLQSWSAEFLQCVPGPRWCCKSDPALLIPRARHYSVPQMPLCTAEALARTHAHQGLHTGSEHCNRGGPCHTYPARRAVIAHATQRAGARDRLEADGSARAAMVAADAQVVHQLVQARRVREVKVAHLGRVGLVQGSQEGQGGHPWKPTWAAARQADTRVRGSARPEAAAPGC